MKLNIPLYLMFFLSLSVLLVGCSKSNSNLDENSDVTMIEAKDMDKYNEEYLIVDSIKRISLSQLYARNDASNCWVAIGSEIYDISTFIKTNPDLDLAQYCGTLSFETVIDSYNLDLIRVQEMSEYIGDLK